MATITNHEELLEDEWYHVRHSGEIPEIALHSSIFHLTEDSDGPRIELSRDHLHYLQDAAMQRYLEMILRDITPANRDTTMYRGVLRTISNWRRFKRFCERHDMHADDIRGEIAASFMTFLENEIKDVKERGRDSSINCSFDDLTSFAYEMKLSLTDIEKDLRLICRNI